MADRESTESKARREAWWRLGVGAAQVVLATSLVASWITQAPAAVVLVLATLTAVVIGISVVRWRMR